MIDRVTEYAKKVVNGEVICGRLHRLACERHLKDLERQMTNQKLPSYDEPFIIENLIIGM